MVLLACSRDEYDPAHDYFSFTNSKQFVTRHLELDLNVDFNKQTLSGYAVLHMERLDSEAASIVLDSRGLRISSIQVAAGEMEAKPVTFEVGETDPVKGEAIRIRLPEDFQTESEFLVKIEYQTGQAGNTPFYSRSRSRFMPAAGCRCRTHPRCA
jgi:aminopeptidase N